jgi:hypothetical protein
MLYNGFGEALYKGSEFNFRREELISKRADAFTPTQTHSSLWGNDPEDDGWEARLQAVKEARQYYRFDKAIYNHLFKRAEFESALQSKFPKIFAAYTVSPENQSYFISHYEINQQFPNIRVHQLHTIIKQDITEIFDDRGKKLEGYRECEEVFSQKPHKVTPSQAISNNWVLFVRTAIPSVLAKEFPNLIGSIPLWEIVLQELTDEKEQIAAKIAILKFKGKTHVEAYDIIHGQDPGKQKADKIGYIRKQKDTAQMIANRHHLPMPSWDTREQNGPR